MKCYPALLPLLVLALLPSCESSYGHARVHWLNAPEGAPQHAQVTATAPTFAEPHPLPQSHSGFTYMPTYPRTHSTWKNEQLLSQQGEKHVMIDLATQRGMFFINGQVAMDFPVCTGRADKPTPSGSFTITQKNINHRSNIYHVAMPYFMRLTNDGIGLHVGYVARQPSSHGCIRLPREACIPLFQRVSLGTRVDIR